MAITLKPGKGIAFEAVPASGQVRVRIERNGRPQYLWPNRLILPDDALLRLKREADLLYYPPPKSTTYLNAAWAVNACADADDYREGLLGLDRTAGGRLPIFNHPRAVALTRRDLSARLLAGTPGLIAPHCARFLAEASDSFQKTFEAEGFRYPVLVRPAASQTGRDLVRIDGPMDWPKIYQTHWRGKIHYMTRFEETRGADGYLKMRVAWIVGAPYVHSVTHSAHWRINHNTGETPPDAFAGRERDIVEAALADPGFQAMVAEIGRRSGMDVLGMDLGLREDGAHVLFEANAAMTMVHDKAYYDTDTARDRLRRLHRPLEKALSRAVAGFITAARAGTAPLRDELPPVAETFSDD